MKTKIYQSRTKHFAVDPYSSISFKEPSIEIEIGALTLPELKKLPKNSKIIMKLSSVRDLGVVYFHKVFTSVETKRNQVILHTIKRDKNYLLYNSGEKTFYTHDLRFKVEILAILML